MFVSFSPLIRRVGAVAMSSSSIVIIKSRTWATASNILILGTHPIVYVCGRSCRCRCSLLESTLMSWNCLCDVLRAELFAFYTQSCSPFTCKAVRLLHAKLLAFYTQSCSRSTGKAVWLLHAKLFAIYMQGSSIYLAFAELIYNCLTLNFGGMKNISISLFWLAYCVKLYRVSHTHPEA